MGNRLRFVDGGVDSPRPVTRGKARSMGFLPLICRVLLESFLFQLDHLVLTPLGYLRPIHLLYVLAIVVNFLLLLFLILYDQLFLFFNS